MWIPKKLTIEGCFKFLFKKKNNLALRVKKCDCFYFNILASDRNSSKAISSVFFNRFNAICALFHVPRYTSVTTVVKEKKFLKGILKKKDI